MVHTGGGGKGVQVKRVGSEASLNGVGCFRIVLKTFMYERWDVAMHENAFNPLPGVADVVALNSPQDFVWTHCDSTIPPRKPHSRIWLPATLTLQRLWSWVRGRPGKNMGPSGPDASSRVWNALGGHHV